MPVERGGVELCQTVDLGDITVHTIADWNVNQAIVCPQGYSWLGALLCQGVQASAGTSTQDDAQNSL